MGNNGFGNCNDSGRKRVPEGSRETPKEWLQPEGTTGDEQRDEKDGEKEEEAVEGE